MTPVQKAISTYQTSLNSSFSGRPSSGQASAQTRGDSRSSDKNARVTNAAREARDSFEAILERKMSR